MSQVKTYLLEHALVGDRVEADVLVEVDDGRFTRVEAGGAGAAERLLGLALPGLANCHSHAFHRALRGRTQRGPTAADRGSFWTWREQMYDLAGRLTPDNYGELARATYAEMRCAGITSVGEFHYLHHQPDGTPYDDPNEMAVVLIEAAREAGIRITLLDTCYLSAGIEPDGTHRPPEGIQTRFSDGDAEQWAVRFEDLASRYADDEDVRIGAAIHSVRAVPKDQVPTVVEASRGRPLHVHLSEQPIENEQCLAAHGRTPTELLHDLGVLGTMTTAVHATHLSERDIELLGSTGTHACFCPTTERDLGDGIGPSRALHHAGAQLTLGSDSQAVIDLFEEMRAVELNERLASGIRGHWTATELLEAATTTGHTSLGFTDAGRIAVGQRADLVVLDLLTPRTAGAGTDPETAVFAATAADVTRIRTSEPDREDTAFRLRAAVEEVWSQ